jgi:hypothetical protein
MLDEYRCGMARLDADVDTLHVEGIGLNDP